MERESVKFGPEYQYNNAVEKKLLNKHFINRYQKEKKIFGTKNISEKFLKMKPLGNWKHYIKQLDLVKDPSK